MEHSVVERLRSLLRQQQGVVTAYLFGSAATGREDARDLDVAVVLRPVGHGDADQLRAELGLQATLEAALDVPVDLHALDRLPVDLQVRVMTTGALLVDRDPSARMALELRARNLLQDFLPQLEVLRAAARERLASRG